MIKKYTSAMITSKVSRKQTMGWMRVGSGVIGVLAMAELLETYPPGFRS